MTRRPGRALPGNVRQGLGGCSGVVVSFSAFYAGDRGFDSRIGQFKRSALRALPMQSSSVDSAE